MIEQRGLNGGGPRRLGALSRAAAEDARVPVALPLNEALTFPAEVARYVAETGVDTLSISVGNVHRRGR